MLRRHGRARPGLGSTLGRTTDEVAQPVGSEAAVSYLRRRLVILAQYDPEGGLPAHVRIHLEGLRPIATRLVLVSNSPLSADAWRTSERICDSVIVRENIGWDFAAWRDALAVEDMAMWNAVVLTNSSVVGPLFPLQPITDEMDGRGFDFWGMVHSRHRGAHLQSWFLSFGSVVTNSEAWQLFWNEVEDLEDKKQVVQRYEIGLTQTLRANKFHFGQLVTNPRFPRSLQLVHVGMLRRIRVPVSVNYVNITKALHRELVEQGMPYVKASLLWGKDFHRRCPIEQLKEIPGVDYPWEEIGL